MSEQGATLAVSTMEAARQVSTSPKVAPKRPEENFCYRCGERGHFATKCPNPENQAKVIRKLIHSLKVTKDNQQSGDTTTSDLNCGVKTNAVTSTEPAGIPEGLIGPPSIVPEKVNGHCCNPYLIVALRSPLSLTLGIKLTCLMSPYTPCLV